MDNERPYTTPALNRHTIPNDQFREIMQSILEKGKRFRFRAPGFSMTPFIKDGDIITIESLKGKAVRTGDVVAFHQPPEKALSVHRIIKSQHGSYLIRGDNNPQPDGWVTVELLIGRVCRVERNQHNIRLGLGPERIIIGHLSRLDLLSSSLRILWPLVKPFAGKRFQ
jgi:signal peptidase I